MSVSDISRSSGDDYSTVDPSEIVPSGEGEGIVMIAPPGDGPDVTAGFEVSHEEHICDGDKEACTDAPMYIQVAPAVSVQRLSTSPSSPRSDRFLTAATEELHYAASVPLYSPDDPRTVEVVSLATDMYEAWDVDHRGYLHASEVTLHGMDQKFLDAIVRVLAFNSNIISKENVVECIYVLKYGDLSSKVKLLVQFMDSDSNRCISYDELKEYLKVSDDSMIQQLGLMKKRRAASENPTEESATSASNNPESMALTYEDLLSIFQESDRGLEAISIFCEQILRIFTAAVQFHGTTLLRRNTIGTSSGQLAPGNDSFLFSNWCLSLVFRKPVDVKHYLETMSHADVFKLWLVGLQIALWLINFFYYKSHGFPLAFCIAKGFGLNLRILSLFMYLTMARTTMGQLYSVKWLRPFIPLGINIEVHSFLGFAIAMHMLGHTFGHIAYQTIYTSGFQNAFTQSSLLRGSNWDNKLKGDGITGFILLAIVLLMGITACLRSLSSKIYELFSWAHYAYLLYLPMLFLHVPHLWPYFAAIGAVMITERLYDLSHNTLYTTLAYSRPCKNGITYLSVPRYGLATYPGSYYRIKIPALSINEWHPFSLAGTTSSHHLSFFIASSGDWTRALHALVKDPGRRQQTLVQVQGPFLAPASQALIRKPGAKILCVASGIGITPFFSVMATKVSDEVNYENDCILYKQLFQETAKRTARHRTRNSLFYVLLQTQQESLKQQQHRLDNGGNSQDADVVPGGRTNSDTSLIYSNKDYFDDDEDDSALKVVWSIRDVKELLFYLDYVHFLVKSQEVLYHDEEQGDVTSKHFSVKRRQRNAVEVDVYLTGLGNKADPVYMLSQTLFLVSIANQSSSYMKIHFGRPDLEKIVKSFSPEEVYYCGGNILKDKLHDVCCQEKIPFYPEDFDSGGGAVVQAYHAIMKRIRSLF